ncbi:MAG TPA: IS6 family transposase [Steroidobacteraceae bacterium]|nr:IS6 family transposase [Steroidobacteraceae bacterium]
MTKPVARDAIYRHRRFQAEDIEQCVRWYITYRLSYRDLVAMMAERGVRVSHTTILRWVMRYVPDFEKRWARYERPAQSSCRMDETAVSVRGGRFYLYRAVDKRGKTVNSLLCADVFATEEFFRQAVARQRSWPSKINLDGNAATHRALLFLRRQDPRWQSVVIRSRRYLNNIVEQDHRAIKRRCASMLGLKSYRSASITLAGVELAHRIRKQQFSIADGSQQSSLKHLWEQALA